jgi:hypothetical protein
VTERFAAAWWCAWRGSNPPWERKGVRNRFSRSADAEVAPVAVFVRRAYAALEALDEHQYWMRSGADGAKELVEEVLPLAA